MERFCLASVAVGPYYANKGAAALLSCNQAFILEIS